MDATKHRAMVLAAFAADALALGVHWVYNTRVIDKKYGRVDHFIKPMTSYHGTKGPGDFTHYGDQMLVLLESVAETKGFDLDRFSMKWREFFSDYSGYFDKATKGTLENFEKGASPEDSGSGSDDLAGASRIVPLVYVYRHDLDTLVDCCRKQTNMTHGHPLVADAAEFFSRVTWQVLNGVGPVESMTSVAQQQFPDSPIGQWVEEGLDTVGADTRSVIADFGQACAVEMAFPSTIHLIGSYEQDLKTACVENIMAGGDSAARGILVGMVLGAYLGVDAIADSWIAEMNARDRIFQLLNQLDRLD